MDSSKVQRIGGPRSRSASCAPSFIEEARLMNRQVRLARTRNKLRKFSDFSPLEECSDTFDYKKERVCLISTSSDDIQTNCEHTSRSCSNLISVQSSRFGGSVEVSVVQYCITSTRTTHKYTRIPLGGLVVFLYFSVVCLSYISIISFG